MSGRSDVEFLQSVRKAVEHRVGLSQLKAANHSFGEFLYWTRTDFGCAGYCHDGTAVLGRLQAPAVIEPAQRLGQAFDVIGKYPRLFELGDSLHDGVATDLDSPSRADGLDALVEAANCVHITPRRSP